jgi:hypothetical protein
MDWSWGRLRASRAVTVAVVSVIIAATAAVAATVAPSAAPVGWSYNGAAQPVAAGVLLTRAGNPGEAGSKFWTAPVNLAGPLHVDFDASISNGGAARADGIALVFANAWHGANPTLVGESGKALGYGGIPGVAVALDTFQNSNEPSANFVGIANGLNADHTPNYIATSVNVPDLYAGTHSFRVDVTFNHLDIAVDGRSVLAADVALPPRTFLGVTAGNGAFSANHVVTNLRATTTTGLDLLATTATTPAPAPAPAPPPVVTPSASSARPPAGGYFAMLPPGSALPSDAQCAARVHTSSWEPRPENTTANHTVPPAVDLGTFNQWSSTWNATYRPRIDGNFSGTTDEIAQWVACKWGWSDDLVRAQMVQESTWRQSTEGDREPRDNGHCVYDDTRDPCPTSFSIIQVKWYFHPTVGDSSSPQSSYPWIKRSTAFALDLELSEMRGCYDGMSSYLGNTRGDVWGCIQSWYSGAWTPGGSSYSAHVASILNAKPWLTW